MPFRVPAEDLERSSTMPRAGHPRPERDDPAQGSGDRQVLTKVDPAVKGIGAANTMVCDRHDRSATTPTTGRPSKPGARHAAADYDRGDLKGKTVLVLGAGGAARAARLRPAQRAAEVDHLRPHPRRAEQLAEQIAVQVGRLGQPLRRQRPTSIINCTPVGMHPNVDETPYDRLHLGRTWSSSTRFTTRRARC